MRALSSRGRGFSLIETALAVAVVGVGILGVVGLFPAGIEMTRRAVNDTYAAMFAASVIDSIRADVRANPTTSRQALRDRSYRIMVPGWALADAGGNPVAFVQPGPQLRHIVFRHPTDADVEDVHIRYRLDILPEHRVEWGSQTFHQSFPISDGPFTEQVFTEMPIPAMVQVRLMVWVGYDVVTRGRNSPMVASAPTLTYYTPSGGNHPFTPYINENVRYFYASLYLAQ